MTERAHRYGWVPDHADQRDLKYIVPHEVASALPSAVDLRPLCPDVYDQGKLGSCSANAIAAAIEFEQRKLKALRQFVPSRLFVYYNERVLLNTVDTDSGSPLRGGMKTVNHIGVCPEDQQGDPANWPYDLTQYTTRPPDACYAAAQHVRAVRYQRLDHALEALKGCLAEGYPFVFGFTVYENFESILVRDTGVAPLPAQGEQVLGGHAVMAVGYDDARAALLVRNSWGPDWGEKGYFYLPYDYIFKHGLARDFWTVRLITNDQTTPQASGNATTVSAGVTPPPPSDS